jgi:hypothetical protein
MLQFAVVLSCAGALCVLSWAMAFAEIMPNIPGGMSLGKTAVVLMAIVSVLGPDLIPRYDGLMKGTMRQWGLYEWAPPLIGWIVRTLRQVVRDHRS